MLGARQKLDFPGHLLLPPKGPQADESGKGPSGRLPCRRERGSPCRDKLGLNGAVCRARYNPLSESLPSGGSSPCHAPSALPVPWRLCSTITDSSQAEMRGSHCADKWVHTGGMWGCQEVLSPSFLRSPPSQECFSQGCHYASILLLSECRLHEGRAPSNCWSPMHREVLSTQWVLKTCWWQRLSFI